MPEDTYDDDQDQPEGMVPRSHIRDLEAKARQADELAAKVAAMERNEAFRSAGIDPNDAKARYFVKGYDGDVNPDAIKAAALEAGYLSPPSSEGEGTKTPDSMEQVFAASAGAAGAPPSDWQSAMNEIDRIADPEARTDALLSLVERHGVPTTRSSQ